MCSACDGQGDWPSCIVGRALLLHLARAQTKSRQATDPVQGAGGIAANASDGAGARAPVEVLDSQPTGDGTLTQISPESETTLPKRSDDGDVAGKTEPELYLPTGSPYQWISMNIIKGI